MSRCELVKEERRKEKEVKQSWEIERKDAGSKSNSLASTALERHDDAARSRKPEPQHCLNNCAGVLRGKKKQRGGYSRCSCLLVKWPRVLVRKCAINIVDLYCRCAPLVGPCASKARPIWRPSRAQAGWMGVHR